MHVTALAGRAVAMVASGALLVGALGAGPVAAKTVSPESTGVGALGAGTYSVPWFIAPSLLALRAEIDARWPHRSRTSDGAIGDARHQARGGSHNPVGTAHGPEHGTRGAVHGMDITAAGIDVPALLQAVIGDPRVWYVIHDGRIWSRTTGWAPTAQRGDPHRLHIHISLREDSQAAAVRSERSTRSWFARTTTVSDRGGSALTRRIQQALIRRGFAIPAGATGKYGAQTRAAVAAFQRSQGWRGAQADGVAGPETLRRLGVAPYVGGASSAKARAAKIRAAKARAAKARAAKARAAKARADRALAAKVAACRPGARNSCVRELQRALMARGYVFPEGASGYFGPRTIAVVKAFQRAQGWSGSRANGVPGAETLRRLGMTHASSSSSAAKAKAKAKAKARAKAKAEARARAKAKARAGVGPAAYRPGARNGHVRALQRALIVRGYTFPEGATGFYGPRTVVVVRSFQRAQGWTGAKANGTANAATLRLLGLR